MICTCASDGNAILWKSDVGLDEIVANGSPSTYTNSAVLSHCDQQIYSCETMGCVPTPHIMTASEDAIHFWDISEGVRAEPQSISFNSLSSTSSGSILVSIILYSNTFVIAGEVFGGPRNPDNTLYVFDAKPAVTGDGADSPGSPADTLVAVALSNGWFGCFVAFVECLFVGYYTCRNCQDCRSEVWCCGI